MFWKDSISCYDLSMGIFDSFKKDRKQNSAANLNEKIELATSNINKVYKWLKS